MPNEDRIYFSRRAQQHRERAAVCTDPSAQRLHLQFAERYAERAGANTPVAA